MKEKFYLSTVECIINVVPDVPLNYSWKYDVFYFDIWVSFLPTFFRPTLRHSAAQGQSF